MKLPQWLSSKESACNAGGLHEMWVQSLDQEESLEKEMTTRSSILAWKFPRTVHGVRKSQTQLSDETAVRYKTHSSGKKRKLVLTQGSNPGLPHCRQVLYRLSHQGSPHWSMISINTSGSCFSHSSQSSSLANSPFQNVFWICHFLSIPTVPAHLTGLSFKPLVWNECLWSHHSSVDALTPEVLVLGGGAFGMCLGLDEVVRMEPSKWKKGSL